jgi:Lantibiotic dehydratase, N terminus
VAHNVAGRALNMTGQRSRREAGVHRQATDGHVTELPGTSWKVWTDALLRTTGFPADRLGLFHDPKCAAATDAYLAGKATRGEFENALNAAMARSSATARSIAEDPLFKEAVTWQNPSARQALDRLASTGPQPPRNRRERERERMVIRYWQRYCAKTETIGFFGPICWATVDPAAAGMIVQPGPGLLRTRRVYLEHWAVAEVAERLASDPAVRRWLPPVLQPHLSLRQGQVIHPTKPAVALSPAEAAVLAAADGRRPARDIADVVVADAGSGLRKQADVYLLLDRLCARGLVRWTLDVPVHMECERVLREHVTTIGDDEARTWALAQLDRLDAARDQVSAAAGSAQRLPAAIAHLDAEFAAVTGGSSAARKPGTAYAGRRIFWEEATRDLTLTVGKPVLDAIAAPLAVMLHGARWLAAAMGRAYLDALRTLYANLSAELESAEVPLGQLWFFAQGLFYGSGNRPADRVTADFARRWARLFALESRAPTASGVRISSSELLPALGQIFPAQPPQWSNARLHSPDIQVCAESADAINAGRFVTVLGELHVAWATNTCSAAVSGHADPAALRAALAADLGPGRIRPLLPVDWPRNTPRLSFGLDDPGDTLLGILPAPGADPGRLIPVTSMTVAAQGHELVARALDGRHWALLDVFGQSLSEVTVEAFKLAGTGPHTPRITIDQMVVARETWRTTLAATGLLGAGDDHERFLATRRWRDALAIPERVFAKVATETKPMFVDLTSPLCVASFHHMLRAARAAGSDETGLSVTEMMPLPEHAWVPDASGRKYLSEIRLQVRDWLGQGPLSRAEMAGT